MLRPSLNRIARARDPPSRPASCAPRRCAVARRRACRDVGVDVRRVAGPASENGRTCETRRVLTRRLTLDRPLDLAGTLGIHVHGGGDTTIRVRGSEAIRAMRTVDGPATVHLRVHGATLTAAAWGSGAARALDGVDRVGGL